MQNVAEVVKGSSSKGYLLKKPSQSINYVECHDNLTFYDKLKKDLVTLKESDTKNYIILSLGLVVLSLGIPFIHAGEELMRSKKGIDNTYNLGLDINGISYQNKEEYQDIIDALKCFIKIRKEEALYKINNPDIIDQILTVKATPNNTLLYETDNLVVIFKNNCEKESFEFDNGEVLFRGTKAVNEKTDVLDSIEVGVYIIKK
jgi:pullulanase